MHTRRKHRLASSLGKQVRKRLTSDETLVDKRKLENTEQNGVYRKSSGASGMLSREVELHFS